MLNSRLPKYVRLQNFMAELALFEIPEDARNQTQVKKIAKGTDFQLLKQHIFPSKSTCIVASYEAEFK